MDNIIVHTAKTEDPNIFTQKTVNSTELEQEFNNYDWNGFLVKANEAIKKDIGYEPPVEFENKSDKNSISFFPAGEPDDYNFLVFYTRPKNIKKWFGLSSKFEEQYTTQVTTFMEIEEALECLKAFETKNYKFLDKRIKN
ncbi:MAG: hypothetical protein BM557_08590 [Flavobacterium sp. MedPE-SWcel]|uniref:hypothetical protein n=1 Tax=uncultured Flavobacterium sp. TaxID=165435 RepID=UPI00091C9EB8|nr:hypothetical protein [uncultured Flavobacterium sp.]OIQ17261.1 MAG: hypothetical protein BM557_08590 [Flavobacterium sp. MedPE-SWcel]